MHNHQQLKALDPHLATLQSAAAPKPRFAFKRAAKAAKAPLDAPAQISPSSNSTAASPPIIFNPTSSQLSISGRQNSFLTLQSLDAHSLTSLPSHSSLSIANLNSCMLNLLPTTGDNVSPSFEITALHIRNLRRTIVVAPPIEGSILLHDCDDCVVVVGCHQVCITFHSRQR